MATYDRHVLFVDDDVSLQKVIKHLLEPRGVKITGADNGAIAYKLMQEGLNPDVIIADLEMPVMNGMDLFRLVRANKDWVHIPFIVLTAHAEKSALRQAMTLGVDDFLTKPFDGERLLLTIYNKAKRVQELTNYAEAAHETLDYIRRDMARMFTHELRTPLVSLNMVVDLLKTHRNDLSESDMEELYDTLQSGITRLNRLVEQMVMLIQLDTGELQKLIEVASRPGPLWDALTAAVSQARAFSPRQRDIEVLYSDGNVTGEISAEWRTLRHALAELLSNAMSFSPQDRPITVNQWLDNDTISLSISDEGPGIPEERQGDLFRRFNQVERELHDQQGIGMGLYLARNIIESAKGTLELQSNPGEGTTVTVRFPLAK
ncbi:MAG: hybrid sensor histidine kinase/response regulator [Anaerolineae bacterium]|nr:hybrid sensor histidine kinase/response regulator [Anaerolineae bacterium]